MENRLPDGAEVLAPNREHVLHRGAIGASEAYSSAELPPGYRVVEMVESGKAMALPEGRLVPWLGYAERVLSSSVGSSGGSDGTPATGAGSGSNPETPISIWRCEIWTEGLFSLLFWALGWLEAESQRTAAGGACPQLLIDWTDSRILFHKGKAGGCPNLWNHFFEQLALPDGAAPQRLAPADIEAAEKAGRLSVTTRFGPPWFGKFGEFRGADEGGGKFENIKGGRLDEATAKAGRAAFGRWIRVRPHILDRASRMQEEILSPLPASEWLAVHIRRTDKLEQCQANNFSRSELLAQIRGFSAGLACRGIFLCTDDPALKEGLQRDLANAGLRVATHAALLSAGGLPSHKDEALDRRRNAEDVLLEVLLMSRCGALLSTYSNVSVGAVYFSEPGYKHFMFGDAPPVPVASPRPGSVAAPRRCEGCGIGDAPLRCSRCRGAFFCSRGCLESVWQQHKPRCAPAAC